MRETLHATGRRLETLAVTRIERVGPWPHPSAAKDTPLAAAHRCAHHLAPAARRPHRAGPRRACRRHRVAFCEARAARQDNNNNNNNTPPSRYRLVPIVRPLCTTIDPPQRLNQLQDPLAPIVIPYPSSTSRKKLVRWSPPVACLQAERRRRSASSAGAACAGWPTRACA